MKTAIYLRKSRAEEQDENIEDTLARHKETLLEFAKKNNLSITGIYEEVVSGENLYARVQMLKLLSDIESGAYEALLCMDIDRLGRGVMSQQGIILETIKSADVKIITPRKIYDLNNDIDEEYTEFQTFFARRELKTINRRLQRGLEQTIRSGGYTANAPFGYEKCTINKLPSLKVVEDEARYIRMIFDMYVNQNHGCDIISKTLNNLGVIPRRGAKFSRTTVRLILSNAVYIGKIEWNKTKTVKPPTSGDHMRITNKDKEDWIVVDGVHEPIIDEELFNKAQIIRKGKIHPPTSRDKIFNPIAGLLICSNCGEKMQLSRSRSTSNTLHLYMNCPTTGCVKSSSLELIEKAIIKSVTDLAVDIEIELSKRKKDTDVDKSHMENALLSVKKEMTITKEQKNKLHDLLERGVYDIDTFMSRNEILDDKIKNLQATVKQLTDDLNKKEISLEEKLTNINDILKVYDTSTAQSKNTMLKAIIDRVTYYKDKDWKRDRFVINVDFK